MTEQNQNKPPVPTKKRRRKLDIWNKLAVCVLSLFLVGCITVFFVLVNVINDPEGMRFSQDGLTTLSTSRIFDSNGKMIYEFGDEIREDVKYEQIPQSVIDAFLSIEDSRYFDHNGFDLPRFLASALANLRAGGFAQGGSTLTMQMIDNAFTKNQEEKIKAEKEVTAVPTLDKLKLKIQEIYLSLIAEQTIDKEQIFEYYVNRIWFGSGNNTRGIQKAAQYFFNKDISQLNLGESAFLAGTINAPDYYNPLNNTWDSEVDHLKAAQGRRDQTLQLMLNHGYITEEEFNLAKNAKLSFALQHVDSTSSNPYQAFIDQAIEECKTLTGQDPSVIPMDIYTTMISEAQEQADAVCNEEIIPFPNEAFDIGFAMINNENGEVICVAPGRRYHSDAVKHDNSMTYQQPGSSIKPLLDYAPTFDILGWSTEHTVNDKKGDYWRNGKNQPQNSDRKYDGEMPLADALGHSKNTTAAAALQDLIDAKGNNYWIDYLKKLGFDSEISDSFDIQYSIGASNMMCSPIELANAYSMLANKGSRIEAHRIRKVVRRSDNQEIKAKPKTYDLVSPDAAFMTSFLLRKVVANNYGNLNEYLQSNYPVYGKSGTSDWGPNNYGIPEGIFKDEWSIGYTSAFTIATWSGYTDEYRAQGWYFDYATLIQAQAFKISHYMLDYCQKFANYKEIGKTNGVVSYEGGYIKKEFKSKGDNTDVQNAEKEKASACTSSGGEWDDDAKTCACPEGYELKDGSCQKPKEEDDEPEKDPFEAERNACITDGGTWDSSSNTCIQKEPDPQPQQDPNQDACLSSGGAWNGNSCTCPQDMILQGNACAPAPED